MSVTVGITEQAVAKNGVLINVPNGFEAHQLTESTIFDGATGNAIGRVLLTTNDNTIQVGIAIPSQTFIRFSMTYITAD